MLMFSTPRYFLVTSINNSFTPLSFLADVQLNTAPNSFAKSLASISSTFSSAIKSYLFAAIPITIPPSFNLSLISSIQ